MQWKTQLRSSHVRWIGVETEMTVVLIIVLAYGCREHENRPFV